MPDDSRQLQSRFILHLVVALQGRLGLGEIPLNRAFVPLDALFSDAEPDLHAAKSALAKVVEEWDGMQAHTSVVSDQVRAMITQALEFLTKALDDVLVEQADADEFISVVFQCRDRIMALDLMLRAQVYSGDVPEGRCSASSTGT